MLILMIRAFSSQQHISLFVQPSFQNTPPFGISNIPVLGGVSGAFGIVDPSRSSGFRDPFWNVQSSGKVTFHPFHLFSSFLLGSQARTGSCQNFSSEQIVSVLDC